MRYEIKLDKLEEFKVRSKSLCAFEDESMHIDHDIKEEFNRLNRKPQILERTEDMIEPI